MVCISIVCYCCVVSIKSVCAFHMSETVSKLTAAKRSYSPSQRVTCTFRTFNSPVPHHRASLIPSHWDASNLSLYLTSSLHHHRHCHRCISPDPVPHPRPRALASHHFSLHSIVATSDYALETFATRPLGHVVMARWRPHLAEDAAAIIARTDEQWDELNYAQGAPGTVKQKSIWVERFDEFREYIDPTTFTQCFTLKDLFRFFVTIIRESSLLITLAE